MSSETPSSAPTPGAGQAGGSHLGETLVGLGIVAVGIGLGIGAKAVSSEAGYGGVGPNFVPWLVSIMLTLCGVVITWQARTGGFRDLSEGAETTVQPYWLGFMWVSAGLLLNAALLNKLGFALGCTLCYTLAVHGLRKADRQAKASAPRTWVTDVLTGLTISLPVYWFFTKFLDINLPGLTGTGWI